MLKLFLVIICIFLCWSCNTTDNKPLVIKFSADSSAILVSNIDAAALLHLKNNIKTDSSYQKLVSVLETPAEDDSTSMERDWPGKLVMKEDDVIFQPDSPFLEGKTYLVQTQLNMSFGDIEQMIKGNVRAKMNFQQQVLKR